MALEIVIALVISTSVILCRIIAKPRGSNPVLWGVMGAIFGPLAIPFVFMSKKREQE